MFSGSVQLAASDQPHARLRRKSHSLAREAPLLPVALAMTAGIVLDRSLAIPFGLPLVAAFVALAFLVLAYRRGSDRFRQVMVLLLAFFLGAGWHAVRQQPLPNDVGHVLTASGTLLRLGGVVVESTVWSDRDRQDPLRSRAGRLESRCLIHVTKRWDGGQWQEASGKVQLTLHGRLDPMRVGEEITWVGMTFPPRGPANPGERDLLQAARDRGISGHSYVEDADVIVTAQPPWSWSPRQVLARLRGWAARTLDQHVPNDVAPIARALLLGEQGIMDADVVEAYRRTGVLHVLAISGQHLAILCGVFTFRLFGAFSFSWLQITGMRPRRVALAVVLFAWTYALLTGAQPPIVRAALMVSAWALALCLGRQPRLVNSLSLAWIGIALWNPADVFQPGCLLSFLGVLTLSRAGEWFHHYWPTRPEDVDPLDALIEEARPWWEKVYRWALRWALLSLFVSVIVWVAAVQLYAYCFNLVTLSAIWISPLMVVLSVIALFGSFLLLLASLVSYPLADLLGYLVGRSLAAGSWLATSAAALPGAYAYVPSPPAWWVLGFYALLLAFLIKPTWLRRWRISLGLGLVWLVLGLATPTSAPMPGALRCTFLAVGHGACVVLEMPDGRVFLYDAGSMVGPEAATRQIAPFLWQRGIARIDEVLLSHADLDHFNGLPALLARFRVAQVTTTPSFAAKTDAGVQFALADLQRQGVALRVLHRPQVLDAGPVRLEVLHPPRDGPSGTENARSLVLRLRYLDRTILLTGDLESPGLEAVLQQDAGELDVVMAPHHGSPSSNTAAFASWARGKLVVSSEGRPRGRRPDPYAAYGGTLWRTEEQGAVTVVIDEHGISASGYRTGATWVDVRGR